MQTITNNARRRLGLPGRTALILNPGETRAVTQQQVDDIKSNRTALRWIEGGVLTLNDAGDSEPEPTTKVRAKPGRKPQPKITPEPESVALPEGITGSGVEYQSTGGGWWQVWVNGFCVTTRAVRRDEADQIAAEYR